MFAVRSVYIQLKPTKPEPSLALSGQLVCAFVCVRVCVSLPAESVCVRVLRNLCWRSIGRAAAEQTTIGDEGSQAKEDSSPEVV